LMVINCNYKEKSTIMEVCSSVYYGVVLVSSPRLWCLDVVGAWRGGWYAGMLSPAMLGSPTDSAITDEKC